MMFVKCKGLRNYLLAALVSLTVIGCAGINPNPGERSTDKAWTSQRFDDAFAHAQPEAKNGYPWAQLRLGIFYSNGWGVEQNNKTALTWYKKAMAQKAEGGWANGVIVGAAGKLGMFNQNSDAIIAEFNVAQIYSEGKGVEKNLSIALKHINNVIADSKGQAVFFCCSSTGGRSFTQQQFVTLKSKIEDELK